MTQELVKMQASQVCSLCTVCVADVTWTCCTQKNMMEVGFASLVNMLQEDREDARARQVTQNKTEELFGEVQHAVGTVFNEAAAGSSNRSSSTWKAVTKTECALCGETSKKTLTRAHIVSDKTKAKEFGLPYNNERNMLFLCGTKDPPKGTPREEWSCHALFDRREVGLVHDPSDTTMTKFRVVGGPNHWRVATCTTKPSRTSLHGYLARSMLTQSLWFPRPADVNNEASARITTWLKNVSPTKPKAKQVHHTGARRGGRGQGRGRGSEDLEDSEEDLEDSEEEDSEEDSEEDLEDSGGSEGSEGSGGRGTGPHDGQGEGGGGRGRGTGPPSTMGRGSQRLRK